MKSISWWKPFILALTSPLLLWLAYPGGGELWPIVFVMLIPLFVAIHLCGSTWRAIQCGLVAGFLHYILLLYWIVNVISSYGGLPWYVAVPLFVLLALYMALYFGLFCGLALLMMKVFPVGMTVLVLPCIWVGLDWLRSVLLTGFPWMDPGYALWRQTLLVQMADLVGHHGVTFVLVMINVLLAQLLVGRKAVRQKVTGLIGPVFIVLLVVGYSTYRLQAVDESVDEARRIRVGVVQGNISQEMKWSKDRVHSTLEGYETKTLSFLKKEKPLFVVWPETALPFYPKFHPAAVGVSEFVRDNHLYLISGSPWFAPLVKNDLTRGNYYNGALLFEPTGKITDKYFKSHLVPFGEYVPMADFLFFVKPLVEAVGRFSSGEIEQPLSFEGVKVGVLICFESIFPDISRKWVGAGANILTNLTNDAWYGLSSAPHHSLAMTVFRAIETRRSIVRSANTGFSGFIDPSGRVARQSPLFQPWMKSEDVVLSDEKTFYVRYGYLFGPLCFLISASFVIFAVGLSRSMKNED